MTYRSNLEKCLTEGRFAVTAEIGPPKSSDPGKIRDKAILLEGYADAFDVTDNQTAVGADVKSCGVRGPTPNGNRTYHADDVSG